MTYYSFGTLAYNRVDYLERWSDRKPFLINQFRFLFAYDAICSTTEAVTALLWGVGILVMIHANWNPNYSNHNPFPIGIGCAVLNNLLVICLGYYPCPFNTLYNWYLNLSVKCIHRNFEKCIEFLYELNQVSFKITRSPTLTYWSNILYSSNVYILQGLDILKSSVNSINIMKRTHTYYRV